MTPLLYIEVTVFYKAALLIHSVNCLINIGCIPMENSNRCFTVYNELSEERDHREASDVCYREHNGKLAVIENETTQTELTKLMNSFQELKGYYYWIGLKLKLLDNWTWLDGTPYSDGTNQTFRQPNTNGYASLHKKRQWSQTSRSYSYTWYLTTIPFHDPDDYYLSSLCKCKTTDCITNNPRRYFIMQARGWFDARNKCVAAGGDLAVLTAENFPDPQLQIRADINYFVGLSNVRVLSSETETEIKYTNWATGNHINENNCVAISLYTYNSGQWITSDCSARMPFVCEYYFNNATTSVSSVPATVTVAETSENYQSTSKTTKAENGTNARIDEPLFLILGVLVVLIVIAVVVITAAVCYIRTKTAARHNGDTLQGSGGPTGYSAISQQRPTSNIPDVCYSASTGAAAYADEGPEYAQVNMVRKSVPPVTPATGEEYANLPQTQAPLKDKKQPTADKKKKKKTKSAAAAPAHIEESGGTEYACILPSQQNRSTPPGNVEQNVYELASEPVEYATLV